MLNKGDWMILAAAFISFLFSISFWFGFGMTANKDTGIPLSRNTLHETRA